MPSLPFAVHGLNGHAWPVALAAYALALALSLALAARLTPRHWWRRPTLRGGAVLAGGTLAFGSALLILLASLGGPAQPALAAQQPAVRLPAPTLPAASTGFTKKTPTPGARYRVAAPLNLRSGSGVHAARLGVLAAGSRVVSTGAVDGDWWQVRARVDGRPQSGWTSSLWLRRSDED
jgi:hypothetical protein